MDHPLIVTNVQQLLMKEKPRRRKPGDVPYPLDYTRDMLDFGHWDHMFLVSYCGGLTMHRFDSPPSNVLDLGCGGGIWAIEAAKQWKHSTITGFDLSEIQPKLGRLDMEHGDVSQRITWVHGNLLDDLPFPSECFDFVRIVGIGLGVPEDEWQYALEEVSRIMKPGAVLEIIEENLIFPAGSVDSPISDYARSITSDMSFDYWNLGSDEPYASNMTSSRINLRDSLSSEPWTNQSKSSITSAFDPSFHQPSVQDHTKLKAAWEAMLTHRFLTPQLLTVLPFYLSSTFINVRSPNTLHIPLPPNASSQKSTRSTLDGSTSQQDGLEPEVIFGIKSSLRSTRFEDDLTDSPTPRPRPISSWAPMHLAKTVHTISACKESLWVEYERLFGNDASVPLRALNRAARGSQKDIILAQQPSIRGDFETEWSNWQHDMSDRVNIREFLNSECNWDEPSGKPPDWRVWQNNLRGSTDQDASITGGTTADLCRSLRGFVCWKPSS